MIYNYKSAYRDMLMDENNIEYKNEDLPVVEDIGITTDGAMQASGISDNPDLKLNVMNVGRKNVIGGSPMRRGIGGKDNKVGICTCKPKKDNCKKCMKPPQENLEAIKNPTTKKIAENNTDKLAEKLSKLFDRKVIKESIGKYIVLHENNKDQHFSLKFGKGDTENESLIKFEPMNENVIYNIKMSNKTSLIKIVEFIKKKLEETSE